MKLQRSKKTVSAHPVLVYLKVHLTSSSVSVQLSLSHTDTPVMVFIYMYMIQKFITSVAVIRHMQTVPFSLPGYQFNFLNWFYWNLWWQQYSYNWAMYHQQGMAAYPPASNPVQGSGETTTSHSDAGTGTRPNQTTGANTNVDQQPPLPQQQYARWGQPLFNQPWNWNVPQFANPFQFPGTSIGQVYLRTVAGVLEQYY